MTGLFKHQEEGIAFLKKHPRAILADEMGLGKTRQAIVAASEAEDLGTIVVCPASLKENWRREIRVVYPEDEVAVVGSGPQYTIEDAPWVVINYDMLPKYLDQLVARIADGKAGAVIVDEAHYIKGSAAIRAKAVLKLVEGAECVYCLTGTPLLNRPSELFNMLKAVGHPLGKLKTPFVARYCGAQMKARVSDLETGKTFFVDPKKQWGFRANRKRYRVYVFMDDTGATHLDELREEVKDVMLRRLKNDVLDLPPKVRTDVENELSPEWRTAYENAWDAYLLWLEAHPDASRNMENILTAQQLVEIGKLKQVCSLSKVPRIVSDIENAVEQGQKVIVFSQYTETVRTLYMELGKSDPVALTGDMSAEERQKSVDAFEKGDAKVFIANIKAGGVGLNLTAASIVMFADLDWSPGINDQAEDRAHRMGQQGTVNVYRYVALNTIEGDILKLLDEKKQIIQAIL